MLLILLTHYQFILRHFISSVAPQHVVDITLWLESENVEMSVMRHSGSMFVCVEVFENSCSEILGSSDGKWYV